MWFTIELFATAIEAFLQYYCLHKVFDPSKTKVADVCGFIGFVMIQTAAVTFVETTAVLNSYIAALFYVILAVIYCRIFLTGKLVSQIFISFLIEVAILIAVLITVPFISTITSVDYSDVIYSEDLARVFVLLFTKLIFSYFVFVIIRLFKKEAKKLSVLEWVLISSVLLCTFIIGAALVYFTYSMQASSVNSLLIQIVLLAFVAVNVLTLLIVSKMSVKNEEIARYKIENLVMKQQEKSIQSINSKYEDFRTIRHDYKNTVACVMSLLNSGKIQEAQEYLSKHIEIVSKVSNYTYVNISDPIINAVVNNKLDLCSQMGINVKCGVFTDFESIDTNDLSVILFNILDNAIEAEKDVENSNIEIEIKDLKGYLSITVKNKISESVLNNNKDLLTTKDDKELHGIGIPRVRKIVKSHGGFIDFSEKDNYFICHIMIK